MPKRKQEVLRDCNGPFWFLDGYRLKGFIHVRMRSGQMGIRQIDQTLTRKQRKALVEFEPADRDAYILAGFPPEMIAAVQRREELRWAA